MAVNDNLVPDFNELIIPSGTWYIDFDEKVVTTPISGLESVRQAAVLAINTERYEHNIFSHQYGVELLDLFGENQQYVMSEVKRRIEEALMQDDRIISVDNFEYTRTKRALHVAFLVTSDAGKFEAETEVQL